MRPSEIVNLQIRYQAELQIASNKKSAMPCTLTLPFAGGNLTITEN
jgi:hypothetical protein